MFFARKRMLVWISMGLLLGGIFLGARPSWRLLKTWRARQVAVQAQESATQQRWAEAFEKASAAWQLSPNDGQVLRTLARLHTDLDMEQALSFWAALLATSQATDDDAREYVRTAIRLNRMDMAQNVMLRLLQESPKDSVVLELAAEWCARKGNRPAALNYARQSCASQPDNTSARLLLARLLMASSGAEEMAEAGQNLWQLAKRQGSESLQAMELLSQMPGMSPADTQQLLAFISSHPKITETDQLLALEVEIQLQPQTRNQRLDELVEKHRKDGVQQRLEAGRWLNRQREYKRTLDLFSLEDSLQRQDLFLVRMDALAGVHRWDEVSRILKSRKVPLEPVFVELYMARAAKELNDPLIASAHWQRLRSMATGQPMALWYTARYAEKIGERAEARKIYDQLAQQPATTRSACAALIRMMEEEGDTVGLRNLMQRLIELYPLDPSPHNDLAYLDLLLGENIVTAKEVALHLVANQPELLSHRTTLALACLRLNDATAARNAYQGIQINWTLALPGWQAVYASVLAANGENQAARELTQQILLERLKPEERALLQTHVQQAR